MRLPTYVVVLPMTFHWDTAIVALVSVLLIGVLLLLLRKHLKRGRDVLTFIRKPLVELDRNPELNEECRKLVDDALRQSENLDAIIGRLIGFRKVERHTDGMSRQRFVRTDDETVEAVADEADDGRDLILLVEDDRDTLDCLERSLSDEYTVLKACNGNDALVIAQEMNPDIVISDMMIPGLAGDELCRTLKSSVATSHIPVILLTAMAARETIVHCLEAGANDFMIKPFDAGVLKARVKNILKHRSTFRKDIMNADIQNDSADYANQMDKEFLNKVMGVMAIEMQNSSFTVNDFCRRLGVSRTVLYNKIKTLTGRSPNEFIKVVRLNKAKELLESHRYMISEVADMVGYSDSKYFSVCYKKQFGVSPSKV